MTQDAEVKRTWVGCGYCGATGGPDRGGSVVCSCCEGKKGWYEVEKHTRYYALGGPLDGTKATEPGAGEDYVRFNASFRRVRRKNVKFPKCVLIHKSLLNE